VLVVLAGGTVQSRDSKLNKKPAYR